MSGPAPKPTALKLVTGNAGKRPINKKEPKPRSERPKVPAHLSPKAKTAFKNVCDLLEDMGVLTIADGMALELLCDAYAEWRDLDKLIKSKGHIYTTVATSGEEVIKGNPAVAMRADAWKRVKSMAAEFGLTAASRTKIQTNTPEETDPLEEYLKRKK
ncbi:phage terminase small subunit P27 family [Pontibacter sp. JAM-7]|uniref:phage terminase small subunit P27 family n=1 Tax=Pontibacter sp. JAM-7 TaxID=3366581 RepID=UPI003AF76B60